MAQKTGKIVYAAQEFAKLAPQSSPDGSPVKYYGGYKSSRHEHVHAYGSKAHHWVMGESGLWSLGCDCFAF
jgi:hypothetical protein